jgi:type III secretion system FlhB-like substrate exporter
MFSHKSGKRAVAIRYSEGDDVPVIAAAAKGELAEKLETIAREHSIPVVRDGVLAGILVQEGEGDIPEKLFPAVAEIIAFCYHIDAAFAEKMNRRIGKAKQ